MKVISIFNQKGGVGKTTTNINLSSFLALEGYRVLTIDIDPQGNTTSGLGFDKRTVSYSMYDVLTTDMPIRNVIQECVTVPNLYIAPSTMSLAGAEVELYEKEESQKILIRKLEEVKDDFDFVFLDCPPSLGLLTINSLCASQSVLIPIQCEFYALEGVSQLMNTINLVKKSLNKDLDVEGVVLSMYDSRANLCNDVVEEVKKYFNEKVFKTTIPRNIRLAEAPSFGLPIMLYDASCKGTDAYRRLTKEFLKRNK